jgi:predicted SAM-dependent methyltransferase
MAAFRQFKMDWKLKARAFRVLDRLPMGDQLYCLLQQHVTHTLPRALSPTSERAVNQLRHIERIREHRGSLDGAVLLEFGAGWDLYSNLLYWCLGLDRQIVVDIRRWLQCSAVNAVISHLQEDPPAGAIRRPPSLIRSSHMDADLKSLYGIDYRAPFDAAAMPLEDRSVDIIVTTSVLEHIPLEVCRLIVGECRRVLKSDGLMSHLIDYSDHYSHSDGSITTYNYLQFDDAEWSRYNPAIHFQNRARTEDYRVMFRDAGFQIVSEREWVGDRSELAQVKIHPQFLARSQEELLALGCEFLARPA